MFESSKVETRIYVKIRFSESGSSALANVVYFKNEMMVDFYVRWRWYFEYRAALLRVKYPKAFISYESGPYQFVLPDDVYKAKIKNNLISAKRELTKIKNKISALESGWHELFPLSEHPGWIRVQERLAYYQKRYDSALHETEASNSDGL